MSKVRRYFADTEFYRVDRCKHELISIGIVPEDKNDIEFYNVSSDFDLEKASQHSWIKNNIIDQLPDDGSWIPNTSIIKNMLSFLTSPDRFDKGDKIQIWVDVPAYDGYFLYELFSYIDDYPEYDGFGKMLCATKDAGIRHFDVLSIKQKETDLFIDKLNLTSFEASKPPVKQYHTAIGDAKWIRSKFKELEMIENQKAISGRGSMLSKIKKSMMIYRFQL